MTAPAEGPKSPSKITVKPDFNEQNMNVTFSDRVLAPVFGLKNPRNETTTTPPGYQKYLF
jgi:hypothetical protein